MEWSVYIRMDKGATSGIKTFQIAAEIYCGAVFSTKRFSRGQRKCAGRGVSSGEGAI